MSEGNGIEETMKGDVVQKTPWRFLEGQGEVQKSSQIPHIMKGLRKRNTEPADTEEYFGHNEESREEKEGGGHQMEMHTPLQMPAQKEDPGR